MTKNLIQKPDASQPEPPTRNVRVRTRPIVPVDPPAVPPLHNEPAASTKPPYSVGYGRPPQHTRFQPGRSGNPRGRPKRRKGLASEYRDLMLEKVVVQTAAGPKKMTRLAVLMYKLWEKAAKGDLRATTELLKLGQKYMPDDERQREFESKFLGLMMAGGSMPASPRAFCGPAPDNDDIFTIPDENPWETERGGG